MNSNNVEDREGSALFHIKKDELSTATKEKCTPAESGETNTCSTATLMRPSGTLSNQKEDNGESDMSQDSNQQTNDNKLESHVAVTEGVNSKDDDSLPNWHELLKDATELESLIFCVRRSSARDKLFKLVDNLKKLSGKLKRYEDVTYKINDKSSSMEAYLKKRSIGDIDLPENIAQTKKPRAISFQSKNHNSNSESSQMQGDDEENVQSVMPQSLDPTIRAPLLKHRDKWVQHHKRRSNMHCPDFEASNVCPLGTKCDLWHIFTPKKPNVPIEKDGVMVKLSYTKEDVERAYQLYRKTSLSKNDYCEKIKNNELNFPNYCCAITCPLDHTIYYAQPFPGDRNVKANRSSQGIWWYMNIKDAREAVATQIIFDFKERGIIPVDFMPYELISDAETEQMNAVNKASEMARLALVLTDSRVKEKKLPDIIPLNYMETNYEKRCAQFNTPQKCPYGSKCQYAHVYYPSEVNSTEFPDREALVFAYKENFQIVFQDPFFLGRSNESSMSSPFRVMMAVDDSGFLWYTAAMKCPYEGIIYYAAGGGTGQLNSQNIVLYPSVEDAKLAVAGIVLDSFKKRGLIGHRNISPQMKITQHPPMQGKASPVFPPPSYVASCQQSHLLRGSQSHDFTQHFHLPTFPGQRSYTCASSQAPCLSFQQNQNPSGPASDPH